MPQILPQKCCGFFLYFFRVSLSCWCFGSFVYQWYHWIIQFLVVLIKIVVVHHILISNGTKVSEMGIKIPNICQSIHLYWVTISLREVFQEPKVLWILICRYTNLLTAKQKMSRQLREKEQEVDDLQQKMEALKQEQRKLEKSRREVTQYNRFIKELGISMKFLMN